MAFDFDQEIDRRGTHCTKWEFIAHGDTVTFGDHADPKHGRDRLLPMWVADMDFRCPPAVIEALTARAQQGVFGYSHPCDSYYEAVISWVRRRYGWRIERDWIVLIPGVVPAVNMAVETYVKLNTPGANDGILRGWVDGRLAYSKKATGRFPTDEEIDALGAA